MGVHDLQRERLRRTISWARKLWTTLTPLLNAHGDRVHFRPASTGITMVGLLQDRPQRGRGLRGLDRVVGNFEMMFGAHCRDIPQGRLTGEKALQSFLIRESYGRDRKMASINLASRATNDPVELVFVTDEIALPMATGRIVCDLLALRRDGGRSTPVVLELKDDRMLTRLVDQVENYANIIDAHANLFAELFGALLGESLTFDGPTEKWIVWPAPGAGPEPREKQLAARGIRVVGYRGERDRYEFRVGGAPRPVAAPGT